MNPLAEEVINMAKAANNFLTEEQINDVIEFAPRMKEEDLEQLKILIHRIAEKTIKAMELELVLWKHIATHHRKERRKEQIELEKKEQAADMAEAEDLLNNI